jgi:AcrR family transcriptional regulator
MAEQRADARHNRARILAAAGEVFTERGARASLNEVAKRAGVGAGTLYRHFPSLQALLVAIVAGSVAALRERGRELLAHPDPDAALLLWLRDFAAHAGTMQGLLAVQLAVEIGPGEGHALAESHAVIVSTGAELLGRSARAGTDIKDLLRLVNAIAWADQQVPDDPGLIDRLFAICFG